MSETADLDALSFEDALRQLEAIVHQLETGSASLEDSIDLYARGERLKRHCDARLKAAQARIETLQIGADGMPGGAVAFEA